MYSVPDILAPRRRARVEHEALGLGGETTRPQEAPLDYADEIAERAVELGGVAEAATLDAGPLRPIFGTVLPFAQAVAASTREPMRNRRPGKTVVAVIPPG